MRAVLSDLEALVAKSSRYHESIEAVCDSWHSCNTPKRWERLARKLTIASVGADAMLLAADACGASAHITKQIEAYNDDLLTLSAVATQRRNMELAHQVPDPPCDICREASCLDGRGCMPLGGPR